MKKTQLAGAVVTALAIGVGSASATQISGTSTPNVAIPDNDPAGVSDILSITDAGSIQDITVEVAIDHTWIGDLYFELTGPDGTMVVLMDRPGVPAVSGVGTRSDLPPNGSILFTDAGTIDAEDAGAACVGVGTETIGVDCDVPPHYVPEPPFLAEFQDLDVMGDWTLLISDNAGADLGTWVSWTIYAEIGVPVPEPGTLVLFGFSLAGLAFLVRRRRNRRLPRSDLDSDRPPGD